MRSLSPAEKLLLLFFVLSLPMVNPWVRGDGVGYYAYARSLLIDGDLHFENEWQAANRTFREARVDQDGRLHPTQYTSTGYVENHFSVGPAMLWAPFLLMAHAGVLLANQLGATIPADGYSPPYVITMAVMTAAFGFAALWLAFRLARLYVEERWALTATLGIWLASSLPVYMYFNPSWSHAHSAFTVALFLWYWHRTRGVRTPLQWMLLGLLGALMLNVYYPNGLVLLVPLLESLGGYGRMLRRHPPSWSGAASLLGANLLFLIALVAGFTPTLYTRYVIYGHPLATGYYPLSTWSWTSPAFLDVLFSPVSGLFSWTPVLLLAVLGLFLLRRYDPGWAAGFAAVFLAYLWFIASYPRWWGISSFGNRFFVSLTPLFVIGLAVLLDRAARAMGDGRATRWALSGGVALLVLWNAGLIFQWGTHMIPVREAVSWREVARNQVSEVPVRVFQAVRRYLLERGTMMQEIEDKDAIHLQRQEQR